MSKKRNNTSKKKNNWLAFTFLSIIVLGLAWGWSVIRGYSLNYFDIGWLSTGVISFLFMIAWIESKYVSQHSLFIPYSPIFIIPIVGGVANKLNYLSTIDFGNLLAFFLCGYLASFLIYSLIYSKRKY